MNEIILVQHADLAGPSMKVIKAHSERLVECYWFDTTGVPHTQGFSVADLRVEGDEDRVTNWDPGNGLRHVTLRFRGARTLKLEADAVVEAKALSDAAAVERRLAADEAREFVDLRDETYEEFEARVEAEALRRANEDGLNIDQARASARYDAVASLDWTTPFRDVRGLNSYERDAVLATQGRKYDPRVDPRNDLTRLSGLMPELARLGPLDPAAYPGQPQPNDGLARLGPNDRPLDPHQRPGQLRGAVDQGAGIGEPYPSRDATLDEREANVRPGLAGAAAGPAGLGVPYPRPEMQKEGGQSLGQATRGPVDHGEMVRAGASGPGEQWPAGDRREAGARQGEKMSVDEAIQRAGKIPATAPLDETQQADKQAQARDQRQAEAGGDGRHEAQQADQQAKARAQRQQEVAAAEARAKQDA